MDLGQSEREATAQRDELLGFVVVEILRKDVPAEGMHMTLPLLQREWAAREEERNLTLQAMQKQHRDYVQEKEQEIQLIKSSSSSSSSASASSPPTGTHGNEEQQQALAQATGQLKRQELEMADLRQSLAGKEQEMEQLRRHVNSLVKSLEEERDMVVAMHNQLAAARAQHEEKLVYCQLQIQKEQKAKEEACAALVEAVEASPAKASPSPSPPPVVAEQKEEEKKQVVDDNAAAIQTLRTALAEKEEAHAALQTKLAALEQQLGASAVLLREKEGVLEEQRQKLSRQRSERQELEAALQAYQSKDQTASSGMAAAESTLRECLQQRDQAQAKALELRKELDEARQALSERSGLLVRLKADVASAEQLHATKTAQVASLELGVQEMMHEMTTLKATVAENEGLIAGLRRDLDKAKRQVLEAQEAREKAQKEGDVAKAELEKELWGQREETLQQHKQLREAHEEEVATLKREAQKKSALARELIADKDAQVQALSSKLEGLEEEVASGSHADRKIMELATAQSRRESQQRAEVESCKISLKKLQEALAQKDLELARLTAEHSTLAKEIAGLRRVKQRDGVNVEYLKTVVVEYLSFPPGAASEKASLELVIGTLLAFSPGDKTKIQEGRGRPGLGWLLAPPRRPVKDITALAHHAQHPPAGGGGGGVVGGGVARQVGSPSATIVTGPQASVAGLPTHLGLPHVRRISQATAHASGGRLSHSSSSSSVGEDGEVVVLDGSVGSSSLGSSAGSVSLSVSDFKSLSGHGSGQGGGGGGGGSVTDSPTRPGQLGLFAGLTTRSVGSSSGAGGAASDEPIVSL